MIWLLSFSFPHTRLCSINRDTSWNLHWDTIWNCKLQIMLRCMLQFFPAPYSASLTGLCYLCSQATANRILVNDIPVFHCEFLPVLKFKWRFWALSVGVPLAVIIVYAIWFINKKIKVQNQAIISCISYFSFLHRKSLNFSLIQRK